MTRRFESVKPGDTVGIRSGTGARKAIYTLVAVERLTKTMIVADRRKWYIDNGREVGGSSYLEVMTPKEIADWKNAKVKADAEAEERRKNYNPADNDDHVQAALRSLRDKARTLGEKLQFECELRASSGKERPDWFPQFMMLVQEIYDSENALKSIGLSTTLKSFAEVSSIFA